MSFTLLIVGPIYIILIPIIILSPIIDKVFYQQCDTILA